MLPRPGIVRLHGHVVVCSSKIRNFGTTQSVVIKLKTWNVAILVVLAHLCPFGRSAIKPVRRWMMNWVCDLTSGLEVIG